MANPGEFDDPEKLSVEPDTSDADWETVQEKIHRVEDGHDENYTAYIRRKRREEAKYRHKYSSAEAAERVKRGLLQKDYKPHSVRIADLDVVHRDKQTEIRTPLDPENARQVRADIARYNNLRTKYLADKDLPDHELEEFRDLHAQYIRDPDEAHDKEPPSLIYKPGKDDKTTHEREQSRIKTAVESEYDVKPKLYPRSKLVTDEIQHGAHRAAGDLVVEQKGIGERENVENTIRKYGQEELHPKRANEKLYGATRKSVATTSNEGWTEEPTRFGWESTHRFQREQAKRKMHGLKTGETALGFGERGSGGYKPGVPTERAKFTVGPNQEWHIKTDEWEEQKPLGADTTPGQDKFVVTLKHEPIRRRTMGPSGHVYESGQNIGETLRKAGLVDLETNKQKVKVEEGKAGGPMGGTYTIVTNEGEHLNPDEIAKLKQELHANHNISSFEVVKSAKFSNKRAVVPVGFHKLPKGIKEADVMPGSQRRDIYSSRVGAKFGNRDPITGNLYEGQTDRLGVRVGSRALQHNFDESTDAIGWGTSWRPGNKEIGDAVLALPRARRDRKIYEAAQNEDTLDSYIKQQHPELEQDEVEEKKAFYRQHAKELTAAAGSAAYYSTKKGLPRKIGAKAYHGAEKLPVVGPKVSDAGFKTNLEGFFKDVDMAKVPLAAKMSRFKERALNPLGDPADPTMAGISWDERRLNLPSWRYRKFPINAADRAGRQYERRAANLDSTLEARKEINAFLKQPRISGEKNIYKKWQARSAVVDPAERMSTQLGSHIDTELEAVRAEMQKQSTLIGIRQVHIGIGAITPEAIKYREYLKDAEKKLVKLQSEVSRHPGVYSHEGLRKLWKARYGSHAFRTEIPAGIKLGAKVGFGGAALVGGSLLAVDRYQTYQHNKGQNVRHPLLKTVPARITRPTVSIKKTHEYTIPTNPVTDALDFQGEKIPVGWRASVGKKQVAQLREFSDVSGDPYKPNLPLFGGVGGKPAPVAGSIAKAVTHPMSQSDLGKTKNMYVAGHKIPVDITVGRKERWSDRNHNLRAGNNPYRLSQDDREHLVLLSTESPEEKQRISTFYYGDRKLDEMMNDSDEVKRIDKKSKHWLQGGKNIYDSPEEIKAKAGVGIVGESMTVEQAQDKRANFERTRRRNKRERVARKKHL